MAMPRLTSHSAVSADYLDLTTTNDITYHAEKQGKMTRQENSGVSLPASLSSSSQVAWPTTFLAPGIALNSDHSNCFNVYLSEMSAIESEGFLTCSCTFAVTQMLEEDISRPLYSVIFTFLVVYGNKIVSLRSIEWNRNLTFSHAEDVTSGGCITESDPPNGRV